MKQVIKNDFQPKISTLAEARLADGQRLLAFNDLFIGASSHVSDRYFPVFVGQNIMLEIQ